MRRHRCGSARRSRVTSSWSSVLTDEAAWQAAERKLLKSWWPTSSRAASAMAAGIERHRHVPDAAAIERRRRAAVQDQVAIAPRRRREAGMEVGRHDLGLGDDDRVGLEMEVDRRPHGVGGLLARQDRNARPGPAHARRCRCGPRRAPPRARRRRRTPRPRARPGSTGRCPGAASRRTARRRIRW